MKLKLELYSSDVFLSIFPKKSCRIGMRKRKTAVKCILTLVVKVNILNIPIDR